MYAFGAHISCATAEIKQSNTKLLLEILWLGLGAYLQAAANSQQESLCLCFLFAFLPWKKKKTFYEEQEKQKKTIQKFFL